MFTIIAPHRSPWDTGPGGPTTSEGGRHARESREQRSTNVWVNRNKNGLNKTILVSKVSAQKKPIAYQKFLDPYVFWEEGKDIDKL